VTVLEAVRSAHAAGLSILPVRADGSKAPAVPTWKTYQTTRPTSVQMRAWGFEFRDGFGMIAGPASGCRETWDFDEAATFEAFIEAADACELGAVVARIRAGYEDETPSGGRRWIVGYPPAVTWQDCTLARRPGRDGEPKVKTLIELTTFAILAPSNGSTHPSGGAYVRLSGGFPTIASYVAHERDALLTLARSFDAMPLPEAAPARPAARSVPGVDERPGDDYNRRAAWSEILSDWTHVGERNGVIYLRRPGKDRGISATINARGTDRLHVFTSSTTFDPDQSYSKFGAFAVLHHGGDHKRAALALVRDGYGDQGTTTARTKTTAPAAATVEAPDGFTHPAVLEGLGEPVLQPKPAQPFSGWFARGAVHLVAGSSGAGKSTLMLDVLQTQARGGLVLGHVGGRHDYLVVFADRGKVSNDETLERMRITPGSLPMAHIPPLPNGLQSAAAIVAAVEATDPLPAVVFVEGADMLVEDPNKAQLVAPFMGALRRVAEHYALAIVLSVGAPKSRPHEQYTLARDRVFGSQVWARLANDVLVLSIVSDEGDEPTRDLVVLHRNAAAEKFHLAFRDGRLVETDPAPASDADYVAWFREAEVFLAGHFRKRFGTNNLRTTQLLDGYVAIGTLRTKVRNDKTYYVWKRETAAVSVVKTTAGVVTSPMAEDSPDSDQKSVVNGHEIGDPARENPNDSEPQQALSLVPPKTLTIDHTESSSLSAMVNGHGFTGYTRAREAEGIEALPDWVAEPGDPDWDDPIALREEASIEAEVAPAPADEPLTPGEGHPTTGARRTTGTPASQHEGRP
jgi:hypothetical protein